MLRTFRRGQNPWVSDSVPDEPPVHGMAPDYLARALGDAPAFARE